MESILNSVKKVLGIDPDYDAFDVDIVMHINSVFSDLNQIGIGPDPGFVITDETTEWSSYIGDDLGYSSVKTYMFLRVRLIFDPPPTSFAQAAMQKQIEQFEWRLNALREERRYPWVDPLTTSLPTTV